MSLSFSGISTEVAAFFEALPSFDEDTQICFSPQTIKSVSIVGLGTVAGFALAKRAYTAATEKAMIAWVWKEASARTLDKMPVSVMPKHLQHSLTTKQRVARYAAAALCFAAAGYEVYTNGVNLGLVTKLKS